MSTMKYVYLKKVVCYDSGWRRLDNLHKRVVVVCYATDLFLLIWYDMILYLTHNDWYIKKHLWLAREPNLHSIYVIIDNS